jgi:predicted MPP superfamily phosphohydrolase
VNADIYLFTGDMFRRSQGIPLFLKWLDDLGEQIKPAVAILGNAEHKSRIKSADFSEALRSRGISVLNNDSICLSVRGTEIQIVGVDDPHTEWSDFPAAYAKADRDRWTLLLCHSPDGLAEMDGRRADLMLCGHTHGGQICFPGVGALWAHTRRVRGFIAGWYGPEDIARRVSRKPKVGRLYISRGLGMGGFPARLNCRPELPVFTLRRVEKVKA